MLRSFGASASIVSANDAPVASRSAAAAAAAAAAASSADRSSMLGSRGDFRGDLPLSAAASASAPSDSIVLSGGARAVPPTARAEPPHPKPPPRARAPGVGGGAAAAALSVDCESREGGSAGASPKPPPRTPRAGARTGESKGEPWPNGEPAATVASRAGGVDSRGGCSSDRNRPSSSPCVRIECAPSGSQ